MQPSDETQKVIDQIFKILLSDINNKKNRLFNANKQLVHYTSAIVAREIIEKEELWLRKTIFMNDYSEITYGKQYFYSLLENPEFTAILNNNLKSLTNLNELKKDYHAIINDIEKKTYISCLSEHLPEEDSIGRLSMWRAYGNSSGVALVINHKIIEKLNNSINDFIILPITYSKNDFKKIFIKSLKIINNIVDDKQQFIDYKNNIFKNLILIMYFYVITLKHKGFWEEREWRIILTFLSSKEEKEILLPKTLKRTIENIKGNPEVIYKINLNEFSFINSKGESLLEKIIIGPNANAELLVESFSEILKNKGFKPEQIKNMITVSNIPLRY